MIDAMEGQEVATSDIPGAFLQTDYDKGDIHIKLEGAMVTLLEEIDLEYYKDLIFTDKRGRKCMYAEANKAIYGTLEASLIFWGEISKSLKDMRYQRNEYNWCFMNKIIDNKQCTILWHVDDTKTSHVGPDVVSRVLADIDAEHGNIAKMTITRHKVHKYLGMTIDYSLPGKVIFSMIDYIGICLTVFQKT